MKFIPQQITPAQIIKRCADCPYYECIDYKNYDHICYHFQSGKLICLEKELDDYDNELEEYNSKPLLHSTIEPPKDPLRIPEWCPLEDYNE
jgi:hypothetical protein